MLAHYRRHFPTGVFLSFDYNTILISLSISKRLICLVIIQRIISISNTFFLHIEYLLKYNITMRCIIRRNNNLNWVFSTLTVYVFVSILSLDQIIDTHFDSRGLGCIIVQFNIQKKTWFIIYHYICTLFCLLINNSQFLTIFVSYSNQYIIFMIITTIIIPECSRSQFCSTVNLIVDSLIVHADIIKIIVISECFFTTF